MTTKTKQILSLLEQTKAAIDQYIANNNDDYARPDYLLYTFYSNIEMFATDGVGMAADKIERLMRFFMNPDISKAFTKQFGDMEDVADCLRILHWMFTNMERPKAAACIDREWLAFLHEDKEHEDYRYVKDLFVKYSTLNEMEQHQITIEAKYKAIAA